MGTLPTQCISPLSTQECKWVSSELSGKPDKMMGRGGRVIGNGQAQASHWGGGGSNNPCNHMSWEVELISRFDCHGLVFFITNIIH